MRQPWDAMVWWEIRRIIFNLALAVCGIISLMVIEWIGDRYVKPGEALIEPMLMIMGVVLYAIAANAFYTLGWITEILWSRGDTGRTKPIRFRAFCAGTVFSCLITLFPAVFFFVMWTIMGSPCERIPHYGFSISAPCFR